MADVIRVVLTGDATQLSNVLATASNNVASFSQQAARSATQAQGAGQRAAASARGFNQLGSSARTARSNLQGFASIAGMASNVMQAFSNQGSFLSGIAAGAKQMAFEMATVMPVVLGVRVAMLALQQGVQFLTDSFIEFDKQMTQSTAIMGYVSTDRLAGMEDSIRSLAKTSLFSAGEIAEGLYFIAAAGFDAESAIKALPIATKFAQAGLMEMEQATEYLLDATAAAGLVMTNTYGAIDVDPTVENIEHMANILTQAANESNATVEQMAQAFTGKAGPAARLLGKDVEELSAVLQAYHTAGIKGATASTQLSMMWRDLQSKAIANASTFHEFGVRVFDAAGEMRNTADIVQDIEVALQGLSDEGKRATLMQLGLQDRSIAATLALVGFSDEIRVAEAETRNMGDVMEEVYQKQLGSVSGQFTLLGNNIADWAIGVGRAIQKFNSWLGEQLKPLVEQLIETFGGLKEAATPFFELLGGGIAAGFTGAIKGTVAVLTPFLSIVEALATPLTYLGILLGTRFVANALLASTAFNRVRDAMTLTGAAVQKASLSIGSALDGMSYRFFAMQSIALRSVGVGPIRAAMAGMAAAVQPATKKIRELWAEFASGGVSVKGMTSLIGPAMMAGTALFEAWSSSARQAEEQVRAHVDAINYLEDGSAKKAIKDMGKEWEEARKKVGWGDNFTGKDLATNIELFNNMINPFSGDEMQDAVNDTEKLGDAILETDRISRMVDERAQIMAENYGMTAEAVKGAADAIGVDLSDTQLPQEEFERLGAAVKNSEIQLRNLPPAARDMALESEESFAQMSEASEDLKNDIAKNVFEMTDQLKAFGAIKLERKSLSDIYDSVKKKNEDDFKEQIELQEDSTDSMIEQLREQKDAEAKAGEARVDAFKDSNEKMTDSQKETAEQMENANKAVGDSWDERIEQAEKASEAQKKANEQLSASLPGVEQWAAAMTAENLRFEDFNKKLERLAQLGASPALLEAIRNMAPEEAEVMLKSFFNRTTEDTIAYVATINAEVQKLGQVDVFEQWKSEMNQRATDISNMRNNLLYIAGAAPQIDFSVLSKLQADENGPQIIAELTRKLQEGGTAAEDARKTLIDLVKQDETHFASMDVEFQKLLQYTQLKAQGMDAEALQVLKSFNAENLSKLIQESGIEETYVANLSAGIRAQLDMIDAETRLRLSKIPGIKLDDVPLIGGVGAPFFTSPGPEGTPGQAPPATPVVTDPNWASANGNILQFSSGEVHKAQIARGQTPYRVWAEPETGGEAYIPLGRSKRQRSTNILSTVADMFGYSLAKKANYATGGIVKPMALGGFHSGPKASQFQPSSNATREIITVPVQSKEETIFTGPIQGVNMEDAISYADRKKRQSRMVRG